MKHFARFVAKLYPKAWRDRYAVEFDALLEEVHPGWRPLFDVVRGAVHMQLNTWDKRRILATGAIVGAFVGFGGWIAVPKQYASDAVIQIIPSAGNTSVTDQSVGDRLNDVARAVLSRRSLARIIDSVGLYGHDRAKSDPEAVIEMMRRSITVRPVAPSRDSSATFVIQFLSSDPVIAQRVTQELIACFMDENIREALAGKVPTTLRLDQAPNLSRNAVGHNWWEMSLAGVVAGTLIALVLVAHRNAPKAA
jgi:hypothetical protein